MVYLLSIGFTLLVLALRLMLLRQRENLVRSGWWLIVIGVVVAIVGGITRWTHWLSPQEGDVLANTAIAIGLIGGVLAIQGIVQKEPKKLSCVRCGAWVVALIGVAFVVWFLIVR